MRPLDRIIRRAGLQRVSRCKTKIMLSSAVKRGDTEFIGFEKAKETDNVDIRLGAYVTASKFQAGNGSEEIVPVGSAAKIASEAVEIGGPKGPEPTRYGDWERKGRVSDF